MGATRDNDIMSMNADKFHNNLKSRGKGTKDWANSWSEVEYLGVDERGRDKFAVNLSVGHRVFKDKTDGRWKKHKLTDERSTKNYVLIQSAKCCVEVYPYYAKYFDVHHEEVRLHEERWVVQRLFKEPDIWRDVGAYGPLTTVEETENSIIVTVIYTTDYGLLIVKYIQRDGAALKHEVTFKNTSGGTETFRVLQRWAGIVGAKCNNKAIPHTITTPEEAASIKFQREDGSFTLGEDLWNMIFDPDREEKTDQCLQRPITVESHARGMKVDFIYGSWTLDQNEFLEIDPSTYSNDNPLEDGDIKKVDSVYTRDSIDTKIVIRYNESTGAIIRGYVDWSTDAIPEDSTITGVDFKYHGLVHEADCHIHERDNMYTAGDSTVYADCGSDTVYADPAGFPVVGINKSVDLGASANADLEAQLGIGWFAIGIQKDNEGVDGKSQIYSENYAATPKPTLYVTYTAATIPTVTTQNATDKEWLNGTYNATLHGTITDTGGENPDRRGFEWGPSTGNYTQGWDEGDSFGVGSFDHIDAFSGTVYYRAYAENSAGYGYGQERSFTPPPVIDPPTVTTQEATGIDSDNGTFHATLHGTITDTGGENCEVRGFYWGPDPCPTPTVECYGQGWEDEDGFGVGAYDHLKSGLDWDTVYYRAYAYNSAGEGWGEERSFSRPLEPPDPPTNVSASDGTYTDKVRITWTKSDGATGYQVYRDGTPLGWLGDVALFDDTGADAPTITPGSADATDGDHTSHVFVYVTGHTTNNGTTHTYKVRARNAGGESGDSATDTGYRGPGSLSYQWYRSNIDADSGYYLIDGATSSVYSDYDAPAPTITHGSVAASGIYSNHVRLTNSGESANVGDGRYYKCRLQAAGCVTQYSTPDRGYRGVGALTYQWYRSAGDSDASYSSIPGATYEPYNDTEAPAPTITKGTVTATDGDHTDKVTLDASGYGTNNGAGRYYKCYHTATGAVSGYTAADRGYRMPGVLTRQWQKSAGDSPASYTDIPGAVSDPYDYTGAPAPTITPGTASASDGIYADYVRLILSGEATIVFGRYYRAKYTATGCVTQYTSANRGYIGVGSITYQWRRSAADSDADYSNITGATYEPYNDTGAPENGDGRWYYCRLNATGAVQQDSTRNRGYRLAITITTMIGGPTNWDWGIVQAGVSVVPITTDGGRTWAWGVATGTIVIPVGGPLGWDWEEHTF